MCAFCLFFSFFFLIEYILHPWYSQNLHAILSIIPNRQIFIILARLFICKALIQHPLLYRRDTVAPSYPFSSETFNRNFSFFNDRSYCDISWRVNQAVREFVRPGDLLYSLTCQDSLDNFVLHEIFIYRFILFAESRSPLAEE